MGFELEDFVEINSSGGQRDPQSEGQSQKQFL